MYFYIKTSPSLPTYIEVASEGYNKLNIDLCTSTSNNRSNDISTINKLKTS